MDLTNPQINLWYHLNRLRLKQYYSAIYNTVPNYTERERRILVLIDVCNSRNIDIWSNELIYLAFNMTMLYETD